MKIEKLRAMSDGLKIALKYAKGKRRFVVIEGMYAESLVAQKLLENGRTVEFHGGKYDLKVDGEHRIEVKCGKLWDFGASASFGKGKQIKEEWFDYCVFVVIDSENFNPNRFFIFSREELEECATHRPQMTMNETPSILFYYRDFKEFEEESEKKGEPIFKIERSLHNHTEEFQDKWDKIGLQLNI